MLDVNNNLIDIDIYLVQHWDVIYEKKNDIANKKIIEEEKGIIRRVPDSKTKGV